VNLTVLFFIDFPAFPPVSRTNDSNAVAAIRETHGKNTAASTTTDAEQARFSLPVAFVRCHEKQRIAKRGLSLGKIDTVLRDVRGFPLLVPFEPHAGKVANILRFINILLQMFLWLPDVSLAVVKRADRCLPERDADVFANSLGEIAVGLGARKRRWQSSKLARRNFFGE